MKPDAFPGRLSRLQRELLGEFSAPGFFLTGGAALVGYYGHSRTTRDLDLFTREAEAFEAGPPELARAAAALGAVVAPLRTTPGFRRYRVVRGGDETVVDLVLDEIPAVHPPEGLPASRLRIDLPEEIAVNKICAVVGRGEPRDLEDLCFLSAAGVDLDEALRQAPRKDAGVGPDTLLMVLPGVPVAEAVRPFRDAWMQRLRVELLPPE